VEKSRLERGIAEFKLTWLALGEDPAARSHRIEQFSAHCAAMLATTAPLGDAMKSSKCNGSQSIASKSKTGNFDTTLRGNSLEIVIQN
jgi:hypothetical protein